LGLFNTIRRQADAPIIEEPAEGGPALQHIVDCLRDVRVARHLAAHTAHPVLQIIHQSGDLLLPDGATLFDRQTIDCTLDGEDRVDPPDRFNLQRSLCEFGQLEEAAVAAMTDSTGDWE
jgi:hypothetical protein